MKAAILDFYENNPGYIRKVIAKKFPTLGDYAQDIEQDAYIKALAGADKLRTETKLKGWLFMIAKNLAIDHIRKSVRRSEKLKQHKDEFMPLDDRLDAEDLSRLEEGVKHLPKSQRVVYDLVMEGHSFAEISHELNITSACVGQRYFRMKNELMRRVKE